MAVNSCQQDFPNADPFYDPTNVCMALPTENLTEGYPSDAELYRGDAMNTLEPAIEMQSSVNELHPKARKKNKLNRKQRLKKKNALIKKMQIKAERKRTDAYIEKQKRKKERRRQKREDNKLPCIPLDFVCSVRKRFSRVCGIVEVKVMRSNRYLVKYQVSKEKDKWVYRDSLKALSPKQAKRLADRKGNLTENVIQTQPLQKCNPCDDKVLNLTPLQHSNVESSVKNFNDPVISETSTEALTDSPLPLGNSSRKSDQDDFSITREVKSTPRDNRVKAANTSSLHRAMHDGFCCDGEWRNRKLVLLTTDLEKNPALVYREKHKLQESSDNEDELSGRTPKMATDGPADIENTELIFQTLREDEMFVDKTMFIHELLTSEDRSPVILTCPSGFGKSSILNMLKNFVELKTNRKGEPDQRAFKMQEELFETLKGGTAISKIPNWKEFKEENLGKWPVIYINFKDYFVENQDETDTVLNILTSLYEQFSYLEDYSEYRIYKELLRERERSYPCMFFDGLVILAHCLNSEFSKKVIILIDEVDYFYRRYMEEKGGAFKATYILEKFLYGTWFDCRFSCDGVFSLGRLSYFTGMSSTFLYQIFNKLDLIPGETFNYQEFSFSCSHELAKYFGFTEDEIKRLPTNLRKHIATENTNYYIVGSELKYYVKWLKMYPPRVVCQGEGTPISVAIDLLQSISSKCRSYAKSFEKLLGDSKIVLRNYNWWRGKSLYELAGIFTKDSKFVGNKEVNAFLKVAFDYGIIKLYDDQSCGLSFCVTFLNSKMRDVFMEFMDTNFHAIYGCESPDLTKDVMEALLLFLDQPDEAKRETLEQEWVDYFIKCARRTKTTTEKYDRYSFFFAYLFYRYKKMFVEYSPQLRVENKTADLTVVFPESKLLCSLKGKIDFENSKFAFFRYKKVDVERPIAQAMLSVAACNENGELDDITDVVICGALCAVKGTVEIEWIEFNMDTLKPIVKSLNRFFVSKKVKKLSVVLTEFCQNCFDSFRRGGFSKLEDFSENKRKLHYVLFMASLLTEKNEKCESNYVCDSNFADITMADEDCVLVFHVSKKHFSNPENKITVKTAGALKGKEVKLFVVAIDDNNNTVTVKKGNIQH